MVVLSECVLDEVLHGASTDFYTPGRFNEVLGRPDKLLIQAVVDDADEEGAITVQIEHSADQRNWKSKNNSSPEIDGELEANVILENAVTALAGADTTGAASLPFVRLRVQFTRTTRAHVKLHVCGRYA
jgi:hypothetical protein